MRTGDLLSTIGNTPLVKLKHLSPEKGARILIKLEGNNPGGSVKDRAAVWMIRQAENDRLLKPGGTILEATSGNTGIGLAMVAAALGYRVKLVVPDTVSIERRKTLEAFGASVITTPGTRGTDGAIEEVRRIKERYPNKYFVADQYANRANWLSHYESTSVEILRQTNGGLHAFVAGMGTGGTLMGHSRRFREENRNIRIIGVQPELGHTIQGLKNMTESEVPKIFEPERLDEVIERNDTQAFTMTQRLAREEGFFVGMSAGAAVSAAIEIAEHMLQTQTVVVIAPDRGDRYLSTGVFRGA